MERMKFDFSSPARTLFHYELIVKKCSSPGKGRRVHTTINNYCFTFYTLRHLIISFRTKYSDFFFLVGQTMSSVGTSAFFNDCFLYECECLQQQQQQQQQQYEFYLMIFQNFLFLFILEYIPKAVVTIWA